MQNSAVCVVSHILMCKINLLEISSNLCFMWRSWNISYPYDSMAGFDDLLPKFYVDVGDEIAVGAAFTGINQEPNL